MLGNAHFSVTLREGAKSAKRENIYPTTCSRSSAEWRKKHLQNDKIGPDVDELV